LVTNKEQKVLGLRSYRYAGLVQPLQHLLKEDVILNSSYDTTKVGVSSKQATLLPNALFESVATAKEYLANLVAIQHNDTIKIDALVSNAAKCIYATSHHIIDEIESCLPTATIYHSSTGLIQNFSTNFDKSTTNIFLHIYNQNISLTVIKKGVGELVEESEIYQLLHKYIKTIKFVGFPNFYTFGNNLKEELPSNFFFDLYSLKLCE
jgi:hypothetical protein